MASATQYRSCHARCNTAIHNWAIYIMAVSCPSRCIKINASYRPIAAYTNMVNKDYVTAIVCWRLGKGTWTNIASAYIKPIPFYSPIGYQHKNSSLIYEIFLSSSNQRILDSNRYLGRFLLMPVLKAFAKTFFLKPPVTVKDISV